MPQTPEEAYCVAASHVAGALKAWDRRLLCCGQGGFRVSRSGLGRKACPFPYLLRVQNYGLGVMVRRAFCSCRYFKPLFLPLLLMVMLLLSCWLLVLFASAPSWSVVVTAVAEITNTVVVVVMALVTAVGGCWCGWLQ